MRSQDFFSRQERKKIGGGWRDSGEGEFRENALFSNGIQNGQILSILDNGKIFQDEGEKGGEGYYSGRRGIFEINANNTNVIAKRIYIQICIIIVQWESVQNSGGGTLG